MIQMEGVELSQLLNEFCTGVCEERTLAHEAQESLLLESIARKQLVKTQQAGRDLRCAVVIHELWRLAVVQSCV